MYKEKWYHSAWFIGVLFACWLLIIPPIVGIILIIQRHKSWKAFQTRFQESNLDQILDAKATLQQLNKDINEATSKKERLLSEYEDIQSVTTLVDDKKKIEEKIKEFNLKCQGIINETMTAQEKLIVVQDELLMQSFGFYEPKYNFENSEAYKAKLDDIRKEQKLMVTEKSATNHSLDWTIGNDKKKGKEFILDTIKLILRAFNNECDNIISKVKFNNIEVSEKRIHKVYEDLNKLTDMQRVFIKREYLELKLQELYLKYEFEQKKQEEKEEQQEIKERMREEARALKELEKAKEKVEKEEKHFAQAIEKMNKQLATSQDHEKEALLEKLKQLEAQLEETKQNKEDVLYRVQNTRAGYVYIISNIGSFGENIYKIGMTRRLEPMDRVKELGDASVPFLFDVHALIFSDDAPGLENALHKALAHKKVNKVNERKEFFNVTLQEIEKLVKQNHNKTVEFTKLAVAEEYRKSISLSKGNLQGAS
ncbi:DUF4041 domain-containing protein [Priestia flexa]|jgi:Domain of unknown function (DUF4041)/T5orf172 domain|uniref:DUF4041 domain-containing protein n=1 Tax=Priestia flexa TaxID=86664 RepID=A0A8I1SNV8_9BACI|nr:DUF4041 domain-containing protein [Priestia flexa]MBN8252844.1 DUF4041 domain-containing protein [Priestia flexa]QCS54448.1 DUF4041 domain-containing protein [Priestia flexa]UIR30409.1 DUF4041 domain-containing protein [Priestia flexa]UZW66625.1 DUF4041 domain-containing protein [Priestia flexa]